MFTNVKGVNMVELSQNRANFLAFLNELKQQVGRAYSGEYVCFVAGLRVSISKSQASNVTVLLSRNDIKKIQAALVSLQAASLAIDSVKTCLRSFGEVSTHELELAREVTAEYERFLNDLVDEALKRRDAANKAREVAYYA